MGELPRVMSGPTHFTDVAGATSRFRRDGCLAFESLLEPSFVDELQSEFNDRFAAAGEFAAPTGSLVVGDRRYMVSPPAAPPFLDERLAAHPLVLDIIERLLEPGFRLCSLSIVASMPGAAAQRRHMDNPPLFGGFPTGLLPPHAVTVFVPLVDLNETTGTTRLWPGSHLNDGDTVDETSFVDPYMQVGDVGMFDNRLQHQGLPNSGRAVRPVLYLVYSRPWFRDHVNFRTQPAVDVASEDFTRLHVDVQRLLPAAAADRPTGPAVE